MIAPDFSRRRCSRPARFQPGGQLPNVPSCRARRRAAWGRAHRSDAALQGWLRAWSGAVHRSGWRPSTPRCAVFIADAWHGQGCRLSCPRHREPNARQGAVLCRRHSRYRRQAAARSEVVRSHGPVAVRGLPSSSRFSLRREAGLPDPGAPILPRRSTVKGDDGQIIVPLYSANKSWQHDSHTMD